MGVTTDSQRRQAAEWPFADYLWTALSRSAPGFGGRKGGLLPGWSLFGPPFALGEQVALESKSNQRHCHAVVCQAAATTDGSLDGEGISTQLVRSLDEAANEVRVEPRKMARVIPSSDKRVLVMADTLMYRRMAKTQVGHMDAALEIGCAFGDCTRILACHAGTVVGVDVAQDIVEESRRRHPHCRFEWLDCFEEPERFRELWAELRGRGALKIFVDVGGDRAAADVCKVLTALGAVCRDNPELEPALVVVKSRELADAAEAVTCSSDGGIVDMSGWWSACAAPPPARSALQEKRKHSRARKAMWNHQGSDPKFFVDRERWRVVHEQIALRKEEQRREMLRCAFEQWSDVADGDARSDEGPCSGGVGVFVRRLISRWFGPEEVHS